MAPADSDLRRIIRRHMLLLMAAQGFSIVVFMQMPALGGLAIKELTGSVELTGVAMSVSAVGQLLTAHLFGRWMDHWGRGPVLAIGAGLSAGGALLIAWAFNLGALPIFLASLLCYGAASGPLRQITVAAADMHPSAARGRAVGMVFMGSILGTVLSPVIARFFTARPGVSDHDSIVLAWIVGAALFACAVPLFLALRPDPLEIGKRLAARDGAAAAAAGRELPRLDFGPDKAIAFAAAIATMATLWGNMSLGMAMTPVAMRHHHVPLGDIMFAISLHVLGMYAFAVPLGAFADRIGRKPMMTASILLTGASNFGALAAADYISQAVFIFLLGIGWSGGIISATAMLSDYTTAEDRGRAFGSAEFITRAALLLFPALGGLLVGRIGFVYAGVAIAATALAPLFFVLRIRRDRPLPVPIDVPAGR